MRTKAQEGKRKPQEVYQANNRTVWMNKVRVRRIKICAAYRDLSLTKMLAVIVDEWFEINEGGK